jgi:hypothetical protein
MSKTEHALPPVHEVHQALLNAIDTATIERLRNVLRHVIVNKDAKDIVVKDLLVDSSKKRKSPSQDTVHQPTKKQKRYEFCTQCEEEYDVTENNSESCEWHPGSFYRAARNTMVLLTCAMI